MTLQPAVSDAIVYVVDDSDDVRAGLRALIESVGLQCRTFATTHEFLAGARRDVSSCLVLDVRLQGNSGLDFQSELARAEFHVPIIFISAHGDIPMTVKAMKAGAEAFFTKPVHEQDLLDAINTALQRDTARRERQQTLSDLRARYSKLSNRERQVMAKVTAGLLNKQIAAEIGLSEITVKVHRHNVMKKLEARSLPELVRMADLLGIAQKDDG
jgi:FixJ family two-component response regulator